MMLFNHPSNCKLETYDATLKTVRSRSSRKTDNGGKLPMSKTGMNFAIIDISKVARPFDAELPFNGHGGARNSALRTSDYITQLQAENLIAASIHARHIGLPFNRFITIHWEAAGLADSGAATATGRFIKLVSDWLTKHGHKTAWIWVRENPQGKGSHVHIAIHLPAGVSLASLQRGWLARITAQSYRKGVIKTERIGRSTKAAITETELASYQINLGGVLGYILKGSSRETGEALNLARLKPQGRVMGKRVATSQNLGPAARARSVAGHLC